MTLLWLKLVHVIAVSVWAGGLMALPLLLAGRIGGDGRRRLAVARYLYLGFLSPAAVITVLSGAGLVAATGLHADWFAAKLPLVTVLALLHALAARQVTGATPSPLVLRASALMTGAVALGIVAIVLAKPGVTFAFRCDGAGELRMLILDQGSARSSCGSVAR